MSILTKIKYSLLTAFIHSSGAIVFGQEFHYGLDMSLPLHFNFSPSENLKFIPEFEKSGGLFISVMPERGFFGGKLQISYAGQKSTYEIKTTEYYKDYITYGSRWFDFSIHAMNRAGKKWLVEYGFSIKTPPQITMVMYRYDSKYNFFSSASTGIGFSNEAGEMQKLSSRIIPAVQVGTSYRAGNFFFGSFCSFDIQHAITSPFESSYPGYFIYPKYGSVSIFVRYSFSDLLF